MSAAATSAAARSLLAAVAVVSLAATVGNGARTKLTQGAPSLWTKIAPLVMLNGQCSRNIDDVLVCDSGLPPDGAEVTVDDGTPFAHVTISAELDRGRVQRVAPCSGPAVILIRKSC